MGTCAHGTCPCSYIISFAIGNSNALTDTASNASIPQPTENRGRISNMDLIQNAEFEQLIMHQLSLRSFTTNDITYQGLYEDTLQSY